MYYVGTHLFIIQLISLRNTYYRNFFISNSNIGYIIDKC